MGIIEPEKRQVPACLAETPIEATLGRIGMKIGCSHLDYRPVVTGQTLSPKGGVNEQNVFECCAKNGQHHCRADRR
jgi:hypothetical protein